MPQVQITVGLHVQVEISGLEASSQGDGVGSFVRFGSGPGMSSRVTGTVTHIDSARGLISVRLDGMRIAGRDSIVVTPDRIIAAIP
jgi:hypothetical protein